MKKSFEATMQNQAEERGLWTTTRFLSEPHPLSSSIQIGLVQHDKGSIASMGWSTRENQDHTSLWMGRILANAHGRVESDPELCQLEYGPFPGAAEGGPAGQRMGLLSPRN